MAAKLNAKNGEPEKTEEELKLMKQRERTTQKQREMNDMELQVTKHPKFLALQEKLSARLARKQKQVY